MSAEVPWTCFDGRTDMGWSTKKAAIKKEATNEVHYSYMCPEDLEEGLAMDIQEQYHCLGMSLEYLLTEYYYVHPNVIACIL